MRIFLRVSLIITKVSAGPSLFSASIIAAEVGALLCKRQKWLHRNHISHGSFIHGLEPHARHAFVPYINRYSQQWTAQCYFICIKTQSRPWCLPSHSIPRALLWRALQPCLYIPHMLSDSRPPAAKHLLATWVMWICVHADVVISITLLTAYFGTPLTFHFAQKSQEVLLCCPI